MEERRNEKGTKENEKLFREIRTHGERRKALEIVESSSRALSWSAGTEESEKRLSADHAMRNAS